MIFKGLFDLNNSYVQGCLSQRLTSIAAWILPGARVLDVGTDHALLPIYLAERGIAESVIAADVARGPYEAAERNVQASGHMHRIEVRMGSGLTVVKPGEVDTIVIAGMGGSTIADILMASEDVVASAQHLIFQPMNAAARLRETLKNLRLLIVEENIMEEAGHLYQLIYTRPATKEQVEEQYQAYVGIGQAWLAQEFGPVNLARRDDALLHSALERQRIHLLTILSGLSETTLGPAADRRQQLTMQVREIESWLDAESTGTCNRMR